MPTLLRKNQMAPAANIAQKMSDLYDKMRVLHDEMLKHGLHDDYSEMTKATDAFRSVKSSLDSKARNTFVALRRGEPVPE